MSDLRKAAQDVVIVWKMYGTAESLRGWMEILEAALAQQPEPVQEPVAWMVYTLDGQSVYVTDNPADFTDEHRVLPIYTAPPQRKPLTDEEITDAVREADLDWQAGWTLDEHEPNRFTTLARAIERKVRGE